MATKKKQVRKVIPAKRKASRSKSIKRVIRRDGSSLKFRERVVSIAEKTGGADALKLYVTGRSSLALKSSLKYPHPGIAAYRASEDRCVPMEGQ